MKHYAANALTVLGLAFGVIGVAVFPQPIGLAFLFISIAFDAVDGHVARKLGTASLFGAELDWAVDCALAIAITWGVLAQAKRLHASPLQATLAPICTILLVFTAAAMRVSKKRFSGRVAVTILAGGAWVFELVK